MNTIADNVDEIIAGFEEKGNFQSTAFHAFHGLPNYELFLVDACIGKFDFSQSPDMIEDNFDDMMSEFWKAVLKEPASECADLVDQSFAVSFSCLEPSNFDQPYERHPEYWVKLAPRQKAYARLLIACPKSERVKTVDPLEDPFWTHVEAIRHVGKWGLLAATSHVTDPLVAAIPLPAPVKMHFNKQTVEVGHAEDIINAVEEFLKPSGGSKFKIPKVLFQAATS